MDWNITETNQLSLQDIDRQGNKLLIGNGYIGYRGTLEEFTKEQKTATIVSGLYDKVGDQWREPVNLPNGGFVQVIYQGEPLHALKGNVVNHTQSLDMQKAIHERQTIFEAADGTHITIHSRRFASLARRHLLCMEYSISADRECEVDIRTGIDGDVWDINGPHLEKLTASEHDGILSVRACTHENAVPVAVSEVVAGIEQTTSMAFISYTDETEKDEENSRSSVKSEASIFKKTLHFINSFPTLQVSIHPPLSKTVATSANRPLASVLTHCSPSMPLSGISAGKTCDIQIEGDPTAQQALRFSLYHLLSIVPTHTESASIPARGMSGQMYKGAVFWDTEIFMLPFFTHAFPALARNLLLYRYHTLAGAHRKAREYGFRGAFYAWESQDTGDDACTLFNVTDVFTNRPVRTYFRDKQVHISADIPYAFWQYYTVSGDESIWQDGGAEVVFECARFFLSYIYYSPDKRRYEILDVTGADEYHERVHNNAFTNRMVYHTFEICLNVARISTKLSLNSTGN